MLIPYEYAYFFGVLYLAALWLFLYWRMPQHRKTMIFFGLSLSWLGVMAEHIWFLKEWWHPPTITGTRIGIEDFLASVTHLTLPALLYKYVFGRDSDEISLDASSVKLFLKKFLSLGVALMALFFLLHVFLGATSPNVFVTCLAVGSLWVSIIRRDLIIPGFLTGVLLVGVVFVMYSLGGIFSPGVVEAIWDKAVLPGVSVLGVPVEDYLFYFFWGWLGGVVYEYVFLLRFSNHTRDLEYDLRFARLSLLAEGLVRLKVAERRLRARVIE
jgi:hypothetical protein